MTEERRGPGRPPKKDTFTMRVLRDFWDAEGNRISAGAQIEASAEAAMDGVESGLLSRVK